MPLRRRRRCAGPRTRPSSRGRGSSRRSRPARARSGTGRRTCRRRRSVIGASRARCAAGRGRRSRPPSRRRRPGTGTGRRARPPAGVPVLMTSPGSSTVYWDRCQIRYATSKIMSAVLESWRGSPLTQERSRSACGSPISSAVTSHGPSGLNVSQDLPLDHWPPETVELEVALGDVVGQRVAGDVGERVGRRVEVAGRCGRSRRASSTSQSVFVEPRGMQDVVVRADDGVGRLVEDDRARSAASAPDSAACAA